MNDHAPTLGALMMALRTRNDWTLQEMSDRTGIPRSTLAKVEHDRLTLGYEKLQQISQRLKMRLSELLAAGGEGDGRPGDDPAQRGDPGERLSRRLAQL